MIDLTGTSSPYFVGSGNDDCIEIFIELLDSSLPMKVSLKSTVEELKEKIRLEKKIPEEEKITLILDGKILEIDRTLESYAITKDAVIYQAEETKPTGGNKSLSFGIQFNTLESVQKQQFSNEAPDYRLIRPGLNLSGICISNECEAFGKVVWIQKGMGTFNICEEAHLSLCPKCKKTADKVSNLGFFDCIYSFTGLKIQPKQERITQNDLVADNKAFTTFKQTGGELGHFASLTVTTKPRLVSRTCVVQ